jgi:hypothetical protein
MLQTGLPWAIGNALQTSTVANVTTEASGVILPQNPAPEPIPPQPVAGTVIKMNESDEAAGQRDHAAGRADNVWRRPSLAPAVMAVASVAVWTNGRWARQVEKDLTQAGADSLSKAARLRRRLRRGPSA